MHKRSRRLALHPDTGARSHLELNDGLCRVSKLDGRSLLPREEGLNSVRPRCATSPLQRLVTVVAHGVSFCSYRCQSSACGERSQCTSLSHSCSQRRQCSPLNLTAPKRPALAGRSGARGGTTCNPKQTKHVHSCLVVGLSACLPVSQCAFNGTICSVQWLWGP